jgi:hypothetical protein
MSGNQPGNIIGDGMVPPFLPPRVDLEGTVGLNQGVRAGEINAFKICFNIVIEGFLIFLREST